MSETSGAGRRPGGPRLWAGALVLIVAFALVVGALMGESLGWLPLPEEGIPDLTRARRFEVVAPGGRDQFLLGLRVHHYRPQTQGEARYRDTYYDTEARDLLRRGYSFRLRARVEGGGGAVYTLDLEQESRFVPARVRRTEVRSDLPDSIGDAISSGDWRWPVDRAAGVKASVALNDLLSKWGVEPARVSPRLVGELQRERFDVSDKGQTWFRLDHEVWTFRRPTDAAGSTRLRLEDLALDVRLGPQDPELLRRVRSTDAYARMIHGIRPADSAPHERALATLGGQ